MRDEAVRLVETVRRAGAEGRRLVIVGSGSKAGKGQGVRGSFASGQPMASAQPAVLASGSDAPDALETMPVGDHAGIIDHRPEELVLTARCGTALKDVDALLAQHRQHLPFEPPMLDGGGTLGGAVATGWSGPGRPWRGSVRDAVLGVEMVNGLGQRLKFGGQVMKNVAGYDLSRLQAGAWGSLGALLSVSLRLSPMPYVERNCRLPCSADQALAWMRTWARGFSPISATCYQDGLLDVRLSGPEAAVQAAAARIGGELSSDLGHWSALRDWALPIFHGVGDGGAAQRRGGKGAAEKGVGGGVAREAEDGAALWRIHCAPAAPLPPGRCLVEWAGARRWWRTNAPPEAVHAYAKTAAGVAVLAHCAPDFNAPIMARLKQAFDPNRVLNPHLSHGNPVQ